MANSEAGTSTINSLGGEYQVFLSFRGPDTGRGFADTLYTDLQGGGIRVFFDDEALRPGQIISDSLLRGIDDSQLYIPIFSPDYASSHWCLRELARMVENTSKSREDGNKKVILPIFYNVKPDDVKLKTELCTKAIAELEQKTEDQQKKFSTEDVETWRGALREVDATKGWELKNYRGDGRLSKSVVEEVMNRLRIKERKVTEALVGMADPIAAINKLLDIDSDDVRLVGISGMGGIGKTTLAKKIFNQLCPRFGNYCSFLDDVRENEKIKGLVELQQLLLFDFSNFGATKDIRNADDGINRIGDTIRNKKVLIVLDDASEGDQIQKLVGVHSLCPGTRKLVTTRDKNILNIKEFKYTIEGYEMEGLSDEDALRLFSTHAFNDSSPPADYSSLSKDIVSTTGGLPLALQAIGSSLYQKDTTIWGETLEKLNKTPHQDVLGKLRITYDALATNEQQIFLDVACFCVGQSKTDAVFAWEGCQFRPMSAIDVLMNRFMIKILDNDILWMHNQFRDLGRAIANEENPEHHVKHMRLWDKDEIICQLNSTEIKESVQTLRLRADLRNPVTVTAEQIKRFPHLRFLWLSNVICEGDFTGCLSELKWIVLYCSTYPPDAHRCTLREPKKLRLENAVVMDLSCHDFSEDEIRYLIEGAAKLKVLALQDYPQVGKTLDFDGNPVLKKLAISRCEYVEEIGCSTGALRELTDLSFQFCLGLKKLPEQIGELKDLQHLSIKYCPAISELPDSIGRLPCLLTLDLHYMHRLQKLPQLPRSLTTLGLKLPSEELQEIQFVSSLESLEVFSVEWCDSLRWLRGLPLLKNLKRLSIARCDSLQVVEGVDELEFLDQLSVEACGSMERIIDASSSKIPNGCWIKVRNCQKLLNTGPDGSSVPWESYREEILNGAEISDGKDNRIAKRTRRE